ncbi:MAG: type VI secretion system ATPase TssH, partial [Lachnospiraceae bacterium]|nr:type VI secretion system ATPase TssH [Lachnospiraceae bacterium]
MNIQKFTQKSIEAINECQKVANEYGNQVIDTEHLLYALLTQEDSLIGKLAEKMGVDQEAFKSAVIAEIQKKPKVIGGQLQMSQDLNNVLLSAEDEAKAMGDDYVSVEHIFLCMMKKGSKATKEIFRTFGITRETFLKALSTVRGNQRITSDNPEATYDALSKYGTDLVERARAQKLDPVIGRDRGGVGPG